MMRSLASSPQPMHCFCRTTDEDVSEVCAYPVYTSDMSFCYDAYGSPGIISQLFRTIRSSFFASPVYSVSPMVLFFHGFFSNFDR